MRLGTGPKYLERLDAIEEALYPKVLPPEGLCLIYFLYDENDVCLYIGATTRFIHRLMIHAYHKPWWDLVKRIDFELSTGWARMFEQERNAILSNTPVFNYPKTTIHKQCTD
jgi:predicted GIY-YIG superfamily endonuclease